MPFEIPANRPSQFDKMIEIATILSEGIDFVRIDLYEINNRVYFSEITFYPASGFLPFNPSEADVILGSEIDLSIKHS